LKKKGDAPVYIGNPNWGYHETVLKDSGFDVRHYRYYDKQTKNIDFDGMINDLENAPDGSYVFIHSCAKYNEGIHPTFN